MFRRPFFNDDQDEDSNEEDTIAEKGESKMELIKAAVDSMKGLTKEEITKIYSSLSEDEVDETLTKAEVARNIVEALKSMSLEEVQKLVKEMGYEDEEEDEDDDDDDDDQEESVKESAAVESSYRNLLAWSDTIPQVVDSGSGASGVICVKYGRTLVPRSKSAPLWLCRSW